MCWTVLCRGKKTAEEEDDDLRCDGRVSLPAVGEGLQCHRGRHLQRLPGQVLVDQLLSPSGQGLQ